MTSTFPKGVNCLSFLEAGTSDLDFAGCGASIEATEQNVSSADPTGGRAERA